MRVFLTGASGFLGSALTPALRAAGHQPVALVRRAPQAGELQWDPSCVLDPSKLANADAVVHLAGKNIAGRWTKQFKQEVLESRARGTQTLATAAAESYRRSGRPLVFLCASGISYYGNRGDELLTEDSPPGEGFLAEVVRQWEAATAPAAEAGVRVVCLRIGVVLGRGGGALKPMLLPFRLGLGGRIGSGRQYWSWIALEDVIGGMRFALENDGLRGPVNLVGPEPVRNGEFVRALGRELHRPTIFPLPAFAVRAALGEMGEELLLASARVLPARLTAAGYRFRYSDLHAALHAAVG
ncbi:MAG TPA: TIGR01777 family oxidoreductase [Terriglobales bacterium]|nr:TIGR01777 family oxidoreductase [Terriglobales bacterium]